MQFPCALLLGMVLCASTAGADTLTLHSGVQVHGKIVQQDDSTIILDVGGRQVRYSVDAVAMLEENDHTGALDKEALRQRAEQRQAELLELTGLTGDERRRVKDLMQQMLSTDDRVATDARQDLVAMGESKDVFKYLAHYVEGLSPRFVAPVLDALVLLDPVKSRPIVREQATSVDAGVRAIALLLLARIKDEESTGLMYRGLVDHTDDVRIAAAEALGMMEVQEATPLLLANLDAADRRVQNSAMLALRKVWNEESQAAEMDSSEAWREFWNTKAGLVPNAVSTTGVMPLVEPGVRFVDE